LPSPSGPSSSLDVRSLRRAFDGLFSDTRGLGFSTIGTSLSCVLMVVHLLIHSLRCLLWLSCCALIYTTQVATSSSGARSGAVCSRASLVALRRTARHLSQRCKTRDLSRSPLYLHTDTTACWAVLHYYLIGWSGSLLPAARSTSFWIE
jgi:hypothetical protein